MHNHTAEFKVTLDVGECNGFMRTEWYANDQLVADVMPTSTDPIDVCFNLTLPGTVKIVLSGKNMNTDTLVDDSGKTVKDKFIKIKQMSLARHPISEHVYMNLCNVTTEQGIFTTAYFGFPGTVKISFNEADPILWHLTHTQYKVS